MLGKSFYDVSKDGDVVYVNDGDEGRAATVIYAHELPLNARRVAQQSNHAFQNGYQEALRDIRSALGITSP